VSFLRATKLKPYSPFEPAVPLLRCTGGAGGPPSATQSWRRDRRGGPRALSLGRSPNDRRRRLGRFRLQFGRRRGPRPSDAEHRSPRQRRRRLRQLVRPGELHRGRRLALDRTGADPLCLVDRVRDEKPPDTVRLRACACKAQISTVPGEDRAVLCLGQLNRLGCASCVTALTGTMADKWS
jgi:hypothetical protein